MKKFVLRSNMLMMPIEVNMPPGIFPDKLFEYSFNENRDASALIVLGSGPDRILVCKLKIFSPVRAPMVPGNTPVKEFVFKFSVCSITIELIVSGIVPLI